MTVSESHDNSHRLNHSVAFRKRNNFNKVGMIVVSLFYDFNSSSPFMISCCLTADPAI